MPLKFFAIVLLLANTLVAQQAVLDPAKPITRIAFGSCLRQDKPAPIIISITAAKPDVFVWLGDNVYGDSDDPAIIRAKYDQVAAIYGYKELRAAVPFLYAWDDHDFGKNDAGREYGFIDQNKQLMLDFFGEPKDSARRKREGNYDSVIIGPPGRRVQFLLLDTRSFRSPLKQEKRDGKKWNVPNDDPKATLLGDAQWAWLEAELKQPADLRIVCSSIQVLPSTHRFEKWANFPYELARLLKLLDNKSLIISGDRHHGAIFAGFDDKLPIEITSSSLNSPAKPTPEDNVEPLRLSRAIDVAHFAMIEFAADGAVSIVYVGVDGREIARENNFRERRLNFFKPDFMNPAK